MKLQLHLIPESSFYSNLRNKLGETQWSQISKMVRGYHGNTCQLCGWVQNPQRKLYTHLHEIWDFKDGVQTLIDFECVCPTCHSVHHWGLSNIQRKDMKFLVKHACKVNECTEDEFIKHIEQAGKEWKARSKSEWELNLDKLNEILSKYNNL